jgi:hypothetical protein
MATAVVSSLHGTGMDLTPYTSSLYGRAVNTRSDAYGFPADEEEMQRLREFILNLSASRCGLQ